MPRPTGNERCKICGAPLQLNLYPGDCLAYRRARTTMTCPSCDYWERIISQITPDTIVVDGMIYRVLASDIPQNGPAKKGMSNKKFLLLPPMRVMVIEDLLCVGKPPEQFGVKLENNARIISYKEALRIHERRNFSCKKKGCFDRYHCLFYPAEKEKEVWNKIPSSHIPGGEKCPIFCKRPIPYQK